jgi:type II secretory pathway component PulF
MLKIGNLWNKLERSVAKLTKEDEDVYQSSFEDQLVKGTSKPQWCWIAVLSLMHVLILVVKQDDGAKQGRLASWLPPMRDIWEHYYYIRLITTIETCIQSSMIVLSETLKAFNETILRGYFLNKQQQGMTYSQGEGIH